MDFSPIQPSPSDEDRMHAQPVSPLPAFDDDEFRSTPTPPLHQPPYSGKSKKQLAGFFADDEKLTTTRVLTFKTESCSTTTTTTTSDDNHSDIANSSIATASASVDDSNNQQQPSVTTVKRLFNNAHEYLHHPGRAFRAAVYLYAERKMLVVFLIHFAATMIIWSHFALIKFDESKGMVPLDAPNYWWKRIVPPLEFGSLHAVLFQMALIPLTMARYTISVLLIAGGGGWSVVDRFVPLHRMLRMHIHLGCTLVTLVVFATVLRFGLFALLCHRGEQASCDTLTSPDVMYSGYGLLTATLILAGTSHVRHQIPYEAFNVIHHLAFIAICAIAVVRTLDMEPRQGPAERSQTFLWCAATILYCICDRVTMNANRTYHTRVVAASSVSGSKGSKMLILNLRRPALFRFQPGQYAYLRLRKIDSQWHPFSIASDPSSPNLQFYVEVVDKKSWNGQQSWTAKIWDMLDGEDCDCKSSSHQIDMEIMGPIGTPLVKPEDYSHALTIGSGIGIVPILSLFKRQVHELLCLDPQAHFREIKYHRSKVQEVELAEQLHKGSCVAQIIRSCRVGKKNYAGLNEAGSDFVKESIRSTLTRRDESDCLATEEFRAVMAQMKKATVQATRSIYGTVVLSVLPVIGITLMGLTISWGTTEVDMYDEMVFLLKYFTVGFQACFAVVAFFIWEATEFLTFVDVVMILIAPFADWYWLLCCESHGTLDSGQLTLFCLLTGYMVMRLWSMVVIPRYRSWRTRVQDEGVRTMERLDVVWVAESASLVAEILPDINDVWKSLVDAWGERNATSACRISIYVTDEDVEARALLENEIIDTLLFQSGVIHFERPNVSALIQDHTVELIANRRHSHSLLAYVGSPHLAHEIRCCKISNDTATAIIGHGRSHQMEFVSASHIWSTPKAETTALPAAAARSKERFKQTQENDRPSQLADLDFLSIRKATSYDGGFV